MNWLPDDCLTQILEKLLSGINYFNFGRVCRRWKRICDYILPNFDGILNFSNSKITDNVIRKLGPVRNINLSYCYHITTACLSYLTNIRYINLIGCRINGEGFKYLTQCQTLLFKKSGAENIHSSETIASLPATLTSLNLSGIDFSHIGSSSFSHLGNLTKLILTRCGDIVPFGMLFYFTNLEYLTIGMENSFWRVPLDTRHYLNLLKYPKKIKYLNISYRCLNGLDLSLFTNLKELRIHNNYHADAATVNNIYDIIIPFESLEYLDISKCSLKKDIMTKYILEISKISHLITQS